MLIIDFETKSRCNLLKAGSYNYAKDPSTDVLCCSFIPAESGDDREWLWYPHDGPLPADIIEEINAADYIAAHNAPFDREIWSFVAANDYGFPFVSFERWYCTSAQMRVNNLPASLEDAARALDARHKKDHRGKQLIKLLSIPREDGTFRTGPALLQEMGEYCLQDSRTTKACVNATRLMTQVEHEEWLVNERVNDRGVLIDVPLALAAQKYAEAEQGEIGRELTQESGGEVTKHTQSKRAAEWIALRLKGNKLAAQLMCKLKDGVEKLTIDKGARAALLDADAAGDLILPDAVFNVISLIEEGNQSSVSKFKNMALRADLETQRVQGAFVYAGAAQTKRFASRGLQLHNFPSRGLYKTEEEAWYTYGKMMTGLEIELPVMHTLKKMLRHAIMAPKGKMLVVGDSTGIEARVLPWLSDSEGGQAKLDLIASGADVYLLTAAAIGYEGNRPVGKVMELACGYEGGVAAARAFTKMYGVVMDDYELGAAISQWRVMNEWVVMFWRDLEKAAKRAVQCPGSEQAVGRIRYIFVPELIEGTLLCILPDDSVIQYPKARLKKVKGWWRLSALKASAKMKVDAKEWPREELYGGRLAGHCTQATAAALLRHWMKPLSGAIAHVHDELILEAMKSRAEAMRGFMLRVMTDPVPWAPGLPLNAKVEVMERYRK
jgi:DNA polymerase